jgi:pyruvate dehydrogenase E1 component
MTNPAVRAYDPTFAYELAAIIRDGIERMHGRGEDLIYYISIYNENYAMAAKPDGVDEGILRGIYRFSGAPKVGRRNGAKATPRVRLVGSGSILLQVIAAQALLAEKFGVAAEVFSAPSWQEARRDALKVDRWNRLHPTEKPKVPFVTGVLGKDGGPIIAASDWMKALPDLLRPWVDAPFVTLGTDGFGRSDTRENLRAYFEIDAPSIAAAALVALAKAGDITAEAAAKGIAELGIDPEKADPLDT